MEKPAQQASPVPSRQPRIVIADDFETLRRGLKCLLGPAICGEAENGQQAVERVMELRPDIVILDWTMPVMNGLQAAKMIRSFAPETKIIVFSLHDGNTVREEALRAGADVFLHKTATGEEILKTIAALIGMGIPEFEAKRYEGRLEKGGILLSVHCDKADEIKRAEEVLKVTNADDVSSTGEASVDTKQTDRDAATKAARGNR